MAGNPDNASLWTEADVFIATELDTPDPADLEEEFGAGWDLVGLLDGEAGFVHSRSETTTDHFAWGGIIVRTGRSNFKQTLQFTALEDNATVRDLLWPGSSDTVLVVPSPARVRLGIEKREGTKVSRLISTLYAEITNNGDWTENESALTKYPFVATIFPTGEGELFNRQAPDDASS